MVYPYFSPFAAKGTYFPKTVLKKVKNLKKNGTRNIENGDSEFKFSEYL